MYPLHIDLSGTRLEIWDLAILLGTIVGYVVLRSGFRAVGGRIPARLGLRYLITVYIAVLGAQLFAYAFDSTTTLAPPPGIAWTQYYLNPLSGPKTLYGAIAAFPLAALVVWLPWRDVPYTSVLDHWTPALFAVLAGSRVGCFLQGCCYGLRSDTAGLAFQPDSVVYSEQLAAGLIGSNAPVSLPVIPTQLVSAIVLLGLCVWSYRMLSRGQHGIFPVMLVVYSAFRFAIEFLRDDPVRNALGPLSTSQWIAAVVISTYFVWKLTWKLTSARRSDSDGYAFQR